MWRDHSVYITSLSEYATWPFCVHYKFVLSMSRDPTVCPFHKTLKFDLSQLSENGKENVCSYIPVALHYGVHLSNTSLRSTPHYGVHLSSTSLRSTPHYGVHLSSTSLRSTPHYGIHLSSTSLRSTPHYGVHLSWSNIPQFFGSHQDLLDIRLLPTRKLLNQGFLLAKLKSSLRKFYGRHHDLINRCGIYVP